MSRAHSALGVLLAAAVAMPALARTEPDPAKDVEVLRGRVLVQRYCAGCHNVSAKGRSIYPAAPPFRELAGRHSGATLQKVAREARASDHFGMPSVHLGPAEAREIALFIEVFATADHKIQRKLSLPSCPGRVC